MARIIFFGSDNFSVIPLRKIHESGLEIVGVVTKPPRVAGRGRRMRETPVKGLAEELGLKIFMPERLDGDFLEVLGSFSPDLFVVAAYGGILKRDYLDLPKKGSINLHPSLLPELRGPAPINWAIIRGFKKTGVTTILMDEGIDTGPILLQREVEIKDDWDSEILSRILADLGGDLLVETIKKWLNGEVSPKPQTGRSSYAPFIKKEDGLIDWKESAVNIVRKVKGLKPWPMAYTFLKGKRLIITDAYYSSEGKDVIPGKVLYLGDSIAVGSGEGLVHIKRLKPEGKREMDAKEFIVGRNIKEGDILGS